MKRAQFYLPEELYQLLEIEAKKEKRAVADLTRELLIESLAKRKAQRSNIFLELEKIAEPGPKYLSIKYKKYLFNK